MPSPGHRAESATFSILPKPVEDMTGRARAYLFIAATRHACVGIACLFGNGTFRGSSFDAIRAVLPLPLWGVVFLAGAVICLLAALFRSEGLARSGLIGSAATSAVWAGGFVAAGFEGLLLSPVFPIIFLAIAAKDVTVCRQPLRSPFEPLLRRVAERGET